MGKALLVIVLGFSTIFSSVLFNMSSSQVGSSQHLVAQYEKRIVRDVAESVTNVASSNLYQDFNWQSGYSNKSLSGAGYSVAITDITGDSTRETKKIQVKTLATFAGHVDSSIAIFMQPAYSYYYFYLNNWPAALDFATGDTVTAPLHSNDRMRVSGSPVFLGKVSSSSNTFLGVLGGDTPKFYGGVEFGTQDIPLPDLTAITNEALAGGHVFNSEVWLRFNGDGTYDYSTDNWGSFLTESIANYNGTIITTVQDIHVEGTVDGEVTVIANRDIFIEDDIVYAANPITNPNCNDYLGLIARHRFRIVENAANSTDVVIHAAIIARHDEIVVTNYSTGGPWGTLTIIGSIAVNDYLPVGTATPTGYVLNHIYDVRLRNNTPPYFPRLSRVEQLFRSN
ncbi:MAG: hypothetical protein ACE5IR_12335 [bacterium]